jgi:farnesyl-diphosphate farnesyltransferase
MPREYQPIDASLGDEAYQERILPHVSRTFALTIPQLPAPLRTPVTNAYLLCRIADTIEDEPVLTPDETLVLLRRFVAVLNALEPGAALARELAPRLIGPTLPAERDLALHLDRVVRITAGLRPAQRAAIQRCLEVMCGGMHKFQCTASLRGLPLATDMDDYCYYVAGVVGEMLTDLFCDYSPEIARRRSALDECAVSFAQGLQMTNILKDVWEDHSRGACWLPQEIFSRHGLELAELVPGRPDARFDAAMSELVGVAHAHLRNALSFTLVIPAHEPGIRRFCLWAIGLAVLTLQRIERTPGFASGAAVKVSHAAVAMTRLLTSAAVGNDWALRRLFDFAARGLPLASPAQVRRGSRPTRRGPEPLVASPSDYVQRFGSDYGHDYGHGNRRSEGSSAH